MWPKYVTELKYSSSNLLVTCLTSDNVVRVCVGVFLDTPTVAPSVVSCLIEPLIERQSDRGQLHDGLGSFACGSVVSTTFVCGHIIQQHYYSVVSSENLRQQVTIVLVTVYELLCMLILIASSQRSSGDITGCSRGIYGDDLSSASGNSLLSVS